MSQWLRARAALVEDLGSAPDTQSQPSVTLAQDLTPSSDIHRHQPLTWYTCMCAGEMLTHINK